MSCGRAKPREPNENWAEADLSPSSISFASGVREINPSQSLTGHSGSSINSAFETLCNVNILVLIREIPPRPMLATRRPLLSTKWTRLSHSLAASTGANGQTKSKVVFSGIQPTGIPHLGNYLGALRQWVKLQNEAEDDTRLIYSLVDLHAITVRQNADELRQWKKESLATLLAIGLDPKRCTIFYQSNTPQHAELMWILSCTAPLGYLSRMTSWKSKLHVKEDTKVEDTSLQLGLFSYPVLQAADVLVHRWDGGFDKYKLTFERATHVPVGEDQAQHLEFTRNCVGTFNHLHGAVFPIPETVISPARRVKSLVKPTQKMSKSDPNPKSRILITDSRDEIFKKIKAAVTDSVDGVTYDPEKRPELANLINIAFFLGDGKFTPKEFVEDCKLKSSFKDKLSNYIEDHIAPIRDRYQEIIDPANAKMLEEVAEHGAEKARASAEQTMEIVRTVIGFR